MPDEDIVVFRLEGVGPFAVPVSVLGTYTMTAAADGGAPSGEPVPLILTGDFLRGHTARRADLVIDRYGCVGLPDQAAIFEPPGVTA